MMWSFLNLKRLWSGILSLRESESFLLCASNFRNANPCLAYCLEVSPQRCSPPSIVVDLCNPSHYSSLGRGRTLISTFTDVVGLSCALYLTSSDGCLNLLHLGREVSTDNLQSVRRCLFFDGSGASPKQRASAKTTHLNRIAAYLRGSLKHSNKP